MEYMESQMQREIERGINDMNDLPPVWAVEKALKLMALGVIPLAKIQAEPNEHYEVIAFARYIAEHEEAPVDPLLIEAREIAAEDYASQGAATIAKAIRDGDMDACAEVRSVLTAIRRGIELGKSS